MAEHVVIAALGTVLAAGLVRLLGALVGCRSQRRFAERYLAALRRAYGEQPLDEERYRWLVFHAGRVQAQLGALGLQPVAATPYAPVPLHLREGLLDRMLPELRAGTAPPALRAACEDALVRHLGGLDAARRQARRRLLNPVIWYGEGVRALLLLPLYVLHWLGLLRAAFLQRLDRSRPFGLLAGSVAVLGLVVTLLILFQGWGFFVDHVGGWAARIRTAG